jgi:hypothetical protein
MVYNTQNYWVFGLLASSSILGTIKHDVSENGCFLPQFGGTHLRKETDPVPKTSCFIVPSIPDDAKSPRTQ